MNREYVLWMDGRLAPSEMQIRGKLLFDLTQHPCSLYCTLRNELTASALFSPAGGPSNHMHERYEIPKHWVHSQVVRRIVAAGTDTIFVLSASPQNRRS